MTTTDDYLKTAEHRRIDADIQRFLASGKQIIHIPRGVSGGDSRAQYQVLTAAQRAKRSKRLQAVYASDPADDSETDTLTNATPTEDPRE